MATPAVDTASRIRRITDSILSLPTLPTVVARILELVDNPNSSAGALAALISQDQALTAKVLKLANSSYYGFSRRIATVRLAIVVLGFDTVRELGLSVSILGAFKNETGNRLFDAGQFWRHTLAVAVGARMLVRGKRQHHASEAFVAGILHDVGKLVLDQYMPDESEAVHRLMAEENMPAAAAETRLLGVDHAMVGSWLAERWNLPVPLVQSIRHHHQPGRCGKDSELTLAVHLADWLAHRSGLGHGLFTVPEQLDDKVAELTLSTFKLDQDGVEGMRDNLYLEYDKAGNLFADLL